MNKDIAPAVVWLNKPVSFVGIEKFDGSLLRHDARSLSIASRDHTTEQRGNFYGAARTARAQHGLPHIWHTGTQTLQLSLSVSPKALKSRIRRANEAARK
jgi:hypothetical protein